MNKTEQTAQYVTDKILGKLKQGVRPWSRPYNGVVMTIPKRANGEPYSGCNMILCWLMQDDYPNPYWLTFNQIKDLGGSVKGERSPIKLIRPMTVKDKNDPDKTVPIGYVAYPVFNASQAAGLPENFQPPKQTEFSNHDERDERVNDLISATGAQIETKDGIPCYVPSLDKICMPAWGDFKSSADYYGTLLHEIVHWTGHKSRLDRLEFKNKKGYAFEELVAELGSAFLMAQLGITSTVRDDHADYIGSWIQALENDNRYILEASKLASKAVDFVLNSAEFPQQHLVNGA